jgi:hypothetical protein
MATTAKAWAAGATGTAVAFLTGLQSAIADNGVTSQEWTTIALATVVGGAAAFGVTWAVPNKTEPPA